MPMKPQVTISLATLLLVGAIIIIFYGNSRDESQATVSGETKTPNSSSPSTGADAGAAPGSRAPRPVVDERVRQEQEKLAAQWMVEAGKGFSRTQKALEIDLGLSSDQKKQLDQVFARRSETLSELLSSMATGDHGDGKALIAEICALIRNKGLREDLTGILTAEQLEAFDAREQKKTGDTVEAHAYRDLAALNELVTLTPAQKNQALPVFIDQASTRYEEEADARAFMSLTYGPLAATMDSSYIRGLSNLLTMDGGLSGDFEYGSQDHQNQIAQQEAERIDGVIERLGEVLDDDQLARYREHLESSPPK